MKRLVAVVAALFAVCADANVTITLSDSTAQEIARALAAAPSDTSAAPTAPAAPPQPALPPNATLVTTSAWNSGFVHAIARGGILVMPFVPTTANPGISFGNYSGSPIARTVTVSLTPADFRTKLDPTGANGPVAGAYGGIGYLAPTLTPGVQYYLNIADLVWGANVPVCRIGGACGDVIVTFQ